MSTLGVLILTLPGMKRLKETLASVGWADAVVVLHASGEPSELAAELPSSAVVRKLDLTRGPGQPLEGIRTDWVLRLWGEERVEPELEEELRELRRSEPASAKSSYEVPLRTMLLGRWVEGSLWEPSPAPRLGRTAEGVIPGWWNAKRRGAQPGTVGLLRGCVADHCPFVLSHAVERINRVSGLWAEDMRRRALRPGPAAMVFFPLRVFLRLYMFERLFARGLAGLTLSTLAAYATLLGGAKWWQGEHVAPRKASG